MFLHNWDVVNGVALSKSLAFSKNLVKLADGL